MSRIWCASSPFSRNMHIYNQILYDVIQIVYIRKDHGRNIKRLTCVCRDIAWLGHSSVVSYRALNMHNFAIIIARITYISSVCRLKTNKGWSRNRARDFSQKLPGPVKSPDMLIRWSCANGIKSFQRREFLRRPARKKWKREGRGPQREHKVISDPDLRIHAGVHDRNIILPCPLPPPDRPISRQAVYHGVSILSSIDVGSRPSDW